MDMQGAVASNRPMAKCNSCNGTITKTDVTCYICREPIPGRKVSQFQSWVKSTALPVKCLVACLLLAGFIAVVAEPSVYGNLGQSIVAVMRPVR